MAIGIKEVEDFKHGSNDMWECQMEELAKEAEKRTALLKSLGIQKCHVVRQAGEFDIN